MSIGSWAQGNFKRLMGRISTAHPPLHLVFPGVLVAGAMLLPLVYLIVRGVSAESSAWLNLIHPRILAVLGRSFILAVAVTISSNVVALPIVWLTTRTDLPGRRFWYVVSILPLVIPSYVGAFAFIAALGPRGLVQQSLAAPMGIERLPDIYGFHGAWIILTLFSYPYIILSVRAALYGLNPAQEDAARSLGDSGWQIFRRITLPQLFPALASGSLLVSLYTLSDFGAVSMLRYTTFTRAIYVQYSASFNRSTAALLALMLVAMTLILLAVEGRIQKRARFDDQARPKWQPRLVELGGWRWLALLYCAGLTIVALGIPLGVIVFWLVRGLQSGEIVQLWIGPAWRSMLASGGAALLAILGALPVALLVVRFPGRFSQTVERTSYIGYALPGIVIALSLVFFGARYVPFLYQTLFLLIFAYVVRFMPQAVGAVKATVLQLNPRFEESARGLGSGTVRVLFSIIIPLVRSGLFSGAALVFLTSMKELPATLLLAPTGYDTLATRVWSATQEAFYARAAAPALLLVAVSAISVAFLVLGDEAGRYE